MWFRRPPPRRSRVTHMEGRIVSLGQGMEHALESPWLSWGVAALFATPAWRLRPRLGEGDSAPIRLGGMLLDIHDLVPQLEEALRLEWLREEVGQVLIAADERNADLGVLDGLADEEVTPLDVFEPAVVLGVVGRGNGGLVVTVLLGGRGLGGGDDLAVLDVRLKLGLKTTVAQDVLGGLRAQRLP